MLWTSDDSGRTEPIPILDGGTIVSDVRVSIKVDRSNIARRCLKSELNL